MSKENLLAVKKATEDGITYKEAEKLLEMKIKGIKGKAKLILVASLISAVVSSTTAGIVVGQAFAEQVNHNEVVTAQYDMQEQINDIRELELQENNLIDMGEFDISYYCHCEQCCGKADGITATGTVATEGRTVAVDPSVIPLGSAVYVDGLPYIAEDTGSAIKGNKVDIYVDSHELAIVNGTHESTVFVERK